MTTIAGPTGKRRGEIIDESTNCAERRAAPLWFLWSLLALTAIALFPFIFRGFATGDSIRYALGLRTILAEGHGAIPCAFNGEMSFGYYVLLEWLVRIVGGANDPSGPMNAINAIAAFALSGLLFLLFARTLASSVGAFVACLVVLFCPGVWFLSHYGHPTLPALAAFAGSLLVWDLLITGDARQRHILSVLFVLLASVTLVLRFDLLLAFGAYPGLLHLRRALSRGALVRLLGAMAVVLLIVGGLRALVLGYVLDPEGGTVAYHLSRRLAASALPKTVLKNVALWVVSANALVVALAVAGLAHRDVRSRFGLLLVFWIVPWAIFLPFRGMDVARIAVPTIPVLVLVGVAWVSAVFRRRTAVAWFAMFASAQFVAASLYAPLVRMYDFQHEFDGHVIAAVPLGFPPVDHLCRQRAVTEQNRIAREVTKERDLDVLLVGHAGLMEYAFHLDSTDDVITAGRTDRGGVVLDTLRTRENTFYFLDLDANSTIGQPIERALSCLEGRTARVHVMPFWRVIPTSGTRLFVDPGELRSMLPRGSAKAP